MPLMIAIVGGSGSGKSWLADRLASALAPGATRIGLDDFYRDRSHLSPARRDKLNFDHPRAIDWPAVERALRECLSGKTVRIPCYDFKTHSRLPRSKILKSARVFLVDGLWLLQRRSIRELFDFSIFLDCSARVRLQRRLARDLRARGRTEASVRSQFRNTVEPMHVRFVAPQARFADIVLKECGNADLRRLASLLRDWI